MQAATQRCPPRVFRERYSLADFEVTRVYGEGPNWAICAASCKWSSELVVLQIYTEVGNVSGCMALALGAAHSLTHHSALLPLYAVFRDTVSPSSGLSPGAADWIAAAAGAGAVDRVVMVYPGGPAQHPLDAGSRSHGSSAPAAASALLPSAASAPASSVSALAGGPPVSERGVIRGLLQPLGDLVAALVAPGLRPTYVCGLDVWLDSPEAPAPGQALFMVPLMCHRRPHESSFDLPPVALPYAAPYVRSNPAAAVAQVDGDEQLAKRWLAWSAAALVHTTLMGSPPPLDKSHRRRKARASEPLSLPTAASSPTGAAAAAAGGGGGVPHLPALSPTSSNNSSPRKNMLAALGIQRAGGSPSPGSGGGGGSSTITMMLQPSHSTHSLLSRTGSGPASSANDRIGSSTNSAAAATTATATPASAPIVMMFGGSAARGGAGHGRSHGSGNGHGRSRDHGLLEPMPLWLSDEAGDWFRRGLTLECSSRAPLDELMRHPWTCRHAVPRSLSSSGHVVKRESLSGLPRELHPLLLDVLPLGVSRPGREECDNMMAEMAAAEAPSVAKPAMPWQVVEGPQERSAAPSAAGSFANRTSQGAGEQQDEETRLEELRDMSAKAESLSKTAKALQAAMAKRGDMGQWVMANPRGTTFEEIAKQNQTQRSQGSYTLPVGAPRQRRSSISGQPAVPMGMSPFGPPSPSAADRDASVRPVSRLAGPNTGPASGGPSSGGQMPLLPSPGGGGGARGRSPARGAAKALASPQAKPGRALK